MVSSLPFLVVLDMCTTLARFDFGIVRGFYCGVVWCVGEVLEVSESSCLLVSNFLIFDRAEWAPRFRDFLGKRPCIWCVARVAALSSAFKLPQLHYA